jgi:uncharacterized protein
MMNRRSFFASAGLPSVAAALQAPPAKGYDVRFEIRRYRKIDVHNHIFIDRGVMPSQLIAAADRLEIEKMAISMPRTTSKPDSPNAAPEACREANNMVLKAMRDFPERFLGQCFVNPYYGREALEEITRCMNSGMIGLGELYTQVRITDPRYFPIIEKCIELKAPLLVHGADARKDWRDPTRPGGSNADDFASIGKRYPEAMIIYGHIGGGGDWEYVCKILRDAPSIYADTSGSVTDEGMIDFAVKCLGVRRLLFATDLSFENGVAKILAATLTEADRRQIFFGNFNEILRKRGNHVR